MPTARRRGSSSESSWASDDESDGENARDKMNVWIERKRRNAEDKGKRRSSEKRSRAYAPPPPNADSATRRAEHAAKAGQHRKAARFWREAALLHKQAGRDAEAADCWQSAAEAITHEDVPLEKREYTRALSWYRLAMQIVKGDRVNVVLKSSTLTSATSFVLQWSTAIRYYTGSELPEKVFAGRTREAMLRRLDEIAEELVQQRIKLIEGELRDSHYRQARKEAAIDRLTDMATLKHNRACGVGRCLGHQPEDAEAAERAVILAQEAVTRSADLPNLQTRALFQLGNTLLLLHRYAEAAAVFRQDKNLAYDTESRHDNKTHADAKIETAVEAHERQTKWLETKLEFEGPGCFSEHLLEAGVHYAKYALVELRDHWEAGAVAHECVRLGDEYPELKDTLLFAEALGTLALAVYRDGLCTGSEAWIAANWAGQARSVAFRLGEANAFGLSTHTYADCMETAQRKQGLPPPVLFDDFEYMRRMREAHDKQMQAADELFLAGAEEEARTIFGGAVTSLNNTLYAYEKQGIKAGDEEYDEVLSELKQICLAYELAENGDEATATVDDDEEPIPEREDERRLSDPGSPRGDPDTLLNPPPSTLALAIAAAGRRADDRLRPIAPAIAPPSAAERRRPRRRVVLDDEDEETSDALLTAPVFPPRPAAGTQLFALPGPSGAAPPATAPARREEPPPTAPQPAQRASSSPPARPSQGAAAPAAARQPAAFVYGGSSAAAAAQRLGPVGSSTARPAAAGSFSAGFSCCSGGSSSSAAARGPPTAAPRPQPAPAATRPQAPQARQPAAQATSRPPASAPQPAPRPPAPPPATQRAPPPALSAAQAAAREAARATAQAMEPVEVAEFDPDRPDCDCKICCEPTVHPLTCPTAHCSVDICKRCTLRLAKERQQIRCPFCTKYGVFTFNKFRDDYVRRTFPDDYARLARQLQEAEAARVEAPKCNCGVPAQLRRVNKFSSLHVGHWFHGCGRFSRGGFRGCNFFQCMCSRTNVDPSAAAAGPGR